MALLDLRKLLPASLRSIKYYSDLINVFQSYLYNDIKSELDRVVNRDKPDTIALQDLPLIFSEYGFELTQGAEFTNSEIYLRREYAVLFKKIPIKGTWRSYQYILYVFALTGAVYPLIVDAYGSLNPVYSWVTIPEYLGSDIFLDTGETLDNNWFLDAAATSSGITRHILLSYVPNYVEDATQFMSTNTCSALYNDVAQNKRKTEIPHFEFQLHLVGKLDHTVHTDQIQKFDLSATYGIRRTIYINPDLTQVATVQLGDGQYTTIDTSITGVQNLRAQYNYPGTTFREVTKTTTGIIFNQLINTTTKSVDFREIAFLDSLGNCIFYADFPFVHFATNMLSSISVTLALT